MKYNSVKRRKATSRGQLYLLFLSLLMMSCGEADVYIDDLGDRCTKELVSNGYVGRIVDTDCLVGKKVRHLKGEFLDGSYYDIADSDRSIKVINLWFGQCPPCVAEIPALNKLADKYAADVRFMSVCRNNILDDINVVEKYDFQFDHFTNSQMIIEKWMPKTGYPMTYVVDDSNVITKVVSGGKSHRKVSDMIYAQISQEIEALLAR